MWSEVGQRRWGGRGGGDGGREVPITMDKHEALRIGDLEKTQAWPKFTTDFLEAVVREGADELTLRKLRTNVGNSRWEPPLVDEDWHDICQAIDKGVEGSEQENMHCRSAQSIQP